MCVVPNFLPKLIALVRSFSLFVFGAILTLSTTDSSLSWAPLYAVVIALLMIGGVYVAARDEKKRPARVFDLRRGSLAFLIGNFGLVMSVGFLAAAWSSDQAFNSSLLWLHGTIAVGAAFATIALFRIADRSRYKAEALELFHYSPSKVTHDFEVVPGLAVALAFYSAPLWYVLSWHAVPALLGILIWAATCGVDIIYPPNPHDQHGL